MNDKITNIVPFGKYKGQPVEALAADRQYFEWLSAQAWFRERYQNIYTLIVNNFAEPDETPEHNALQMRFLDDDFCVKLARPDGRRILSKGAEWILKELSSTKERIEKELAWKRGEIDRWGATTPPGWKVEEIKAAIRRLESELAEETAQRAAAENFIKDSRFSDEKIHRRAFEALGWDVVFYAEWTTGFARESELFGIEIKPALGDDFPAVLRQMKARARDRCQHEHPFLVIDGFTASGATFEQVKAVFAADNFRVLTFTEIERRS